MDHEPYYNTIMLDTVKQQKLAEHGPEPEYGVFYIKNDKIQYKIFIGARSRALTFYSEINLADQSSEAKILVQSNNAPGEPSPEQLKLKQQQTAEEPQEPLEHGLQENTDFLRDRAVLVQFLIHNIPEPEPQDIKMYYKLYWVDDDSQPPGQNFFGFYFDDMLQAKVKRETFSMKESAEEEYNDLQINDYSNVTAKMLVNNGKILF